MDLSGIEISFEYSGSTDATRKEIVRNVQTILTTPLDTCPLYRDFGLDVSYLDHPLDLAQNLFAVAAMEAVERWEPRVRVTSVSFVAEGAEAEGRMKAKVVIADG